MTRSPASRRGATVIETAIVLVLLIFLVCGLISGGFGVFRHQQVACLAQEGARWANVRGGEYSKDGNTPPTRQQIVDAAILPRAASMDPADIDVRVEWIDRGTNTVCDWDAAPKDIRSISASGEYVTNTVRVTVTYRWTPGMFWGPMDLRSVCESPMSN